MKEIVNLLRRSNVKSEHCERALRALWPSDSPTFGLMKPDLLSSFYPLVSVRSILPSFIASSFFSSSFIILDIQELKIDRTRKCTGENTPRIQKHYFPPTVCLGLYLIWTSNEQKTNAEKRNFYSKEITNNTKQCWALLLLLLHSALGLPPPCVLPCKKIKRKNTCSWRRGKRKRKEKAKKVQKKKWPF